MNGHRPRNSLSTFEQSAFWTQKVFEVEFSFRRSFRVLLGFGLVSFECANLGKQRDGSNSLMHFVRVPGVVGTAGAVEADGNRAGAEGFVVPQPEVGRRRRNLHGRAGRGEEERRGDPGEGKIAEDGDGPAVGVHLYSVGRRHPALEVPDGFAGPLRVGLEVVDFDGAVGAGTAEDDAVELAGLPETPLGGKDFVALLPPDGRAGRLPEGLAPRAAPFQDLPFAVASRRGGVDPFNLGIFGVLVDAFAGRGSGVFGEGKVRRKAGVGSGAVEKGRRRHVLDGRLGRNEGPRVAGRGLVRPVVLLHLEGRHRSALEKDLAPRFAPNRWTVLPRREEKVAKLDACFARLVHEKDVR